MAGVFSRSMEIFRDSWGVLKRDKSLVIFPLLSALVTIVLTLSFFFPIVFTSGFLDGEFESNVMYYIALFLLYLIGYFVVIFFNTALISCVYVRLSGGTPNLNDGLRYAAGNLGKIAGWALISATVGMVLQMIRERGGILGRIAAGLFGLAWNLITFFVIPVMIFQNRGVIDSIKESAVIFKQTWGENFVLRVSLGLIIFLAGSLGVIPILLAAMTQSVGVIIVVSAAVVLYWFALGIIGSTLNGIFATALYYYATTKTPPPGFRPEVVADAFVQKKRGLLPR